MIISATSIKNEDCTEFRNTFQQNYGNIGQSNSCLKDIPDT